MAYSKMILARLAARSRRSAESRRTHLYGELPEPGTSTDTEDISDILATRQVIRRALGELSERQRHAVFLRYWEGLSTGDIARALQVPGGTVRSDLARAAAVLRGALAAVFHRHD